VTSHTETRRAGEVTRAQTSDPDPPTLVAKRWRRFGHDRLYVTGSGGELIGWAELTSDLVRPASPEQLSVLNQAVSAWKESEGWEPCTTQALTPAWRGPVPPPSPPGPASATSSTRSDAASAAASLEGISEPQVQPVPDRPWTDLARNAPGAAARAQARTLRDAAPVRTFFARLVNLRTAERAWRIGADGEERVGTELARLIKLDPRWRVLHAVPAGDAGADIDHVVIGPGGIFTLNTKHHPGAARSP
jgi:hypothetical protein